MSTTKGDSHERMAGFSPKSICENNRSIKYEWSNLHKELKNVTFQGDNNSNRHHLQTRKCGCHSGQTALLFFLFSQGLVSLAHSLLGWMFFDSDGSLLLGLDSTRFDDWVVIFRRPRQQHNNSIQLQHYACGRINAGGGFPTRRARQRSHVKQTCIFFYSGDFACSLLLLACSYCANVACIALLCSKPGSYKQSV